MYAGDCLCLSNPPPPGLFVGNGSGGEATYAAYFQAQAVFLGYRRPRPGAWAESGEQWSQLLRRVRAYAALLSQTTAAPVPAAARAGRARVLSGPAAGLVLDTLLTVLEAAAAEAPGKEAATAAAAAAEDVLRAWGAAGRLVVAGRHTARIDALLGDGGRGPGAGEGSGGVCARLGLSVIPAPAPRNRT